MSSFSEYSITETITTGRVSFQRAQIGEKHVLLCSHPRDAGQRRAVKEYRLLQFLNEPSLLRPLELLEMQSSDVLVLEDPGSLPIERLKLHRSLTLLERIDLSIKITDIVQRLHDRKVLHLGLAPSCIFYSPQDLKIGNLAHSSRLDRLESEPLPRLAGDSSMPYLPPEQTGLVHRPIDLRSDLYSLAAVLYFLFTGRPPFADRDASVLLHRIIATPPDPIDSVDPRLPAMLSAVLIRALAKDPDDRYRSIRGFAADLRLCYDAVRIGEPAPDFRPGQEDRAEEFRLPSIVYGREEQLALLHTLYDQATHGNKNVLIVEGEQGTGRTALIREMQRELSLRGAFFARGRPTEAGTASFLTEAIEPVLRRILRLSEFELAEWKERLSKVITDDEAALLTLFPSLEWIVGPRPMPTDPSTIRRQWMKGCCVLLKALSPPTAPMLLFLDDCHLIDRSDMEIIAALIEDADLQSIFIVLSFRSETVLPGIQTMLDDLERTCGYVRRLNLLPLTLHDTERMLADLFSDSVDAERPLAAILHRKTGGNPFYIRELLLLCKDRGWITFDRAQNLWVKDLVQIEQSDVSTNVVTLLSQRIQDLDEEERQLLQFASVIGEVFDLFTLHWISSWTLGRLLSALRHLYELEFIRPEGSSFSVFDELTLEESDEQLFRQSGLTFRFVHERIARTAYRSIEEALRERLHAYVGIHLLEMGYRDADFFHRNLYPLANHLNTGRRFLDDELRIRLATLNLQAGIKALDDGDLDVALSFLRSGLLDAKIADSATCFGLYLHAARTEGLCGSPAASEQLFKDLYNDTEKPERRLRIYRVHISLLTLFGRFRHAVDKAQEALEEFGGALSTDPRIVRSLFVETDILTKLKEYREVRPLVFADQARLQILDLMAAPAAITDEALFNKVTAESLTIIERIGPCDNAPGILARLIRVILPDYELALSIASLLADWLHQQPPLRSSENLYWFSVYAAPLVGGEDSIPMLEEAVRVGYETRDINAASRSILWLNIFRFFTGQPLQMIRDDVERQASILKRQRQEDPLFQLGLWKETLTTILAPHDDQTMQDPIGAEMLSVWTEMQNSTALFQSFFLSALSCYLNDELQNALVHIDAARQQLMGCRGTLLEAACYYIDSLLLYRVGIIGREARLAENIKALRHLAFHAPHCYSIWYGTTDALADLHEGRRAEGVYKLEECLSLTIERGRLMDRALIEDLLYDIYRNEGKKTQEILYFTDALTAYRMWGGQIRVSRMVKSSRENEGILLTKIKDLHDILHDPDIEATNSADTRTLVEASSAIASEITLEGVIRTILGSIVRLSGAESGLFLHRRHGQLRIVARVEGMTRIVYDAAGADPFKESAPIPRSMLLFALRTAMPVIEHNAFEEGDYRNDPYVQAQRLRSCLCLPLQTQGETIGVLYLENRWTGHVFHPGRTELLRQLSGQMAVSLTNADHYESLEDQIRNRTKRLEDSLSQVERLKQQQDVDYYLISVLLRPLLQNTAETSRFDVSFLIRQKKRFRFKRWMVEIGGDLCFGADLTLRGRRYSVLVNGDGMGKSLQGSGGALVLGSVLKALVERTRLNPLLQNTTPGDWLLQSIREIHQVFTTFDGLMFITLIISLLDEERGTLHFINGGHPRPVLYRGGEASFFGERLIVHKPGMKFFRAEPENVEFLRFEAGDVVYFGSDGKDDLIVNHTNTEPIINEDESMFLRIVEDAEGRSDRLYRSLRRRGELSDDLSLIRIAAP